MSGKTPQACVTPRANETWHCKRLEKAWPRIPRIARKNDRRMTRLEKAPFAILVSGAKLAPQGRLRKAQGASPGNKHSNKGSPEGAMQLVPVPKRRLMTSIYLELRSNSLRRPFRAFRNLDLEPRACALGCPAGPLRGPWFRARNYSRGVDPLPGRKNFV